MRNKHAKKCMHKNYFYRPSIIITTFKSREKIIFCYNYSIMKTNFDFFYAIPFPHLLATITITTIATIFAALSGFWAVILIPYVCLLAYATYYKKNHYNFALVVCIFFSAGALLQIKHMYKKYHAHQEFLDKSIILEGVITSINNTSLAKEQTTLLLQTTSISSIHTTPHTASQNILVYVPTKRTLNLQEGQTIAIRDIKLSKPEQGCPYESYLIKEHIWATAFVTTNRINIKNQTELPLHKKCFNVFASHLSKGTASLFNPLFLGKREKNIHTVSMQHNSLYWGIAHHMARSGIHLVTIFGLLMTLLHYLRIRHSYRYALGTLLSIGYFEITCPSISFVRALFMILFQMFSKMNKFTYSSIHALTMTTLIILMHNPLQILFLDFQLSFGVTYIIIWLFRAKYAKTIAFGPASLIRS